MTPYYEAQGIVLYLGNCLDILPSLDQVDHCITDPPYSEHTHAKQWIGHALTANGAPRVKTAHTGLGFDALDAEVRSVVCCELRRLVHRWSLVFTDLEGITGWCGSLSGAGLDYVRTCIWDKVDGAPQFTGDRPAAGAEAIVLAHQPGRKRWNGGGRRNVFREAVNGGTGAKLHPSAKPLLLMRELVRLFSDPGEVILDPFAGSATTGIAARAEGRRAILIECHEPFAEVAARRLERGDAGARQPDQAMFAWAEAAS
jgi:site-specific DNA-methyltransferase (adenine-specific)